MSLLAVVIASLLTLGPAGRSAEGPLVLSGPDYKVRFNKQTGNILSIRMRGQPGPAGRICATARNGSLWELHFRNRTRLAARDFANAGTGSMEHEWIDTNHLRFTYKADRAQVIVDAVGAPRHVDLLAKIVNPTDDVLTFAIPASLIFDPASLDRVVFPVESGLALKRRYYEPQPPGTVWITTTISAEGLRRAARLTCAMRPDHDQPVNVQATKTGRRFLGSNLARFWQERKCVVNRPVTRPADIELLSSPNGPLLAGYRVGDGLFLHLAGRVRRNTARLVAPTFERVLARLRTDMIDSGQVADKSAAGRVVLLAMRNGPHTGSWTDVPLADWLKILPDSKLLAATQLEVTVARSVDEMLAALNDANTFAAVNPYGESFPIGDRKWQTVADAVRAFLNRGGIWAETAGYPFYYGLVHGKYYEGLHAQHPGDFADFLHLATTGGTVSVFGVQKLTGQRDIFTPTEWRTYADDRGGHVERYWKIFAPRGQTWQAPPVRLLIGSDAVAALQAYGRENGFKRLLTDKMPPDVLDRWKQSVLIKYVGGTIADRIRMLDELPAPALVHLVDYLRGGFDKQYPDHLPPRPEAGSPKQFARLIKKARDTGHLVMPYTNPTWWCDEPKGPTFVKHGDAPLLRQLNGELQTERYLHNWGWSICPWHPAALEAADRIVEQFTQDYPVDVLLQDQIGARRMRYDTNPASPNPYAYAQGIFNMAQRAEKHIPVSTENGCDRLINIESQFCGLSWKLVPIEWAPPWRRLHRDWLADEASEYFPLAQYLAADKVIFAHHDLGQFVTNREVLAWTLAIGYQLSYRITPDGLANPDLRDWLHYLDAVQKTIAFSYIGRPLKSFRYLQGSGGTGVLESIFGQVRIVANLTDQPHAVEDLTIAPMGFYATAPGAEAGILASYAGRNYTEDGLWMVRRNDKNKITVTIRAHQPIEMDLPVDDPSRWVAEPPEVLAGRTGNRLKLRLDTVETDDRWQLVSAELQRE
jgi:hypothetical protein